MICLFGPILLLSAVQSIKALSWEKKDEKTAIAYLLYQECQKESHPETIKAQAVLLRSSLKLYTSEEWYRLLKRGVKIEQEKEYIKRKNTYFTAINETDKLVIKDNKKVVRGVYHEISGGATRDGKALNVKEYEHLVSVDSNWDQQAPGFQQVFSFSDTFLKRHFFRNQKDPQIKVIKNDPAGYVQIVQWGNTYISGDMIRENLSLSSACFSVVKQEDQWIFTCKGVGHGLGMSLYGANTLAEQGKNFKEILAYYFPKYEILPE